MQKNKKQLKEPRSIAGYLIIIILAAALLLFVAIKLYAWRSERRIKPAATQSSQTNPSLPGKEKDNQSTPPPVAGDHNTPASGDKTNATTVKSDITAEIQESGMLNGDLVIKVSIKGIGSGTCDLIIHDFNGAKLLTSQTISRSAEILFQSDMSTCTGFVVPSSDFYREGQWQADIKVKNSAGSIVATATHSVQVEK